jgi:plasmid stabilization system protein ParE
MKFRLLPPAAGELRSAAHYYEKQIPGLGHDFLAEIRATIQRIVKWPDAWHSLDAEIRRCRTHRFPYGVIYTLENREVIIIAVMHLHRHPDSWRKNRQ